MNEINDVLQKLHVSNLRGFRWRCSHNKILSRKSKARAHRNGQHAASLKDPSGQETSEAELRREREDAGQIRRQKLQNNRLEKLSKLKETTNGTFIWEDWLRL